ncbi:phosphatidylglycerophosphatase A [Planctomycetota bacterium]
MKRLFLSCFGLGWLPIAPGTWGSVPVAGIFVLLAYLDASAVMVSIVMGVCVVVGSVVCVWLADASIEACGKKDPGEVVVDEFAGQSVTFIAAGFITGMPFLIVAAAGFLFFRLFDIVKPWPVKSLEKLPRGWGILADDLMAGVYAGVLLHCACYLYKGYYLAQDTTI